MNKKKPYEVEYVCLNNNPRAKVVEYFRSKEGYWVVLIEDGESLRFSEKGVFPYDAKDDEIKSILHFT